VILNDGARAESLPQLKIENNDVICSHGATTGGIGQDLLFYLESRGLDPIEAKNLAVLGHLQTVLQRLPATLAAECEDGFSSLLELNVEGKSI